MRKGDLLALALGLGMATAGCEKKAPPTPSPGNGTPESISGTERLGWDQRAGDAVELAAFRYAIYVDGSRSEIAGAACGTAAGAAGFACSGRLPAMSPGAHTIELAAFVVDGGVLESPRSAPLRVIVTSLTTADASDAADPSAFRSKLQERDRPASALGRQTHSVTTADGVRLRIDVLAEHLDAPVDLAFAADGRLFIAERPGRIHVVRTGETRPTPAATLADVADNGGRLLALAPDPAFERTRFVYAVYSAEGRGHAPAFRLARYRETNGVLAERAVLLDAMSPASGNPAATLRFGPDGKLYAALDDGGDAGRAEDLSYFGGKVLRLNADGSTPADQPGATPVFSYAYPSPRGLDWQPSTGDLWIAARESNGAERLSAIGGGAGRSRAGRRAAYDLPAAADATAVAFYRGDLIPEFHGNLLVAARRGGYILRVRFDPAEPTRVIATERLLEDRIGPVTALAVGPDGAIYFCANGALIRLAR